MGLRLRAFGVMWCGIINLMGGWQHLFGQHDVTTNSSFIFAPQSTKTNLVYQSWRQIETDIGTNLSKTRLGGRR